MPEQYKLISSVPTDEMINAGVNTWVNQDNPNKPINFVEILKAMWQAAPEVEQEPVDVWWVKGVDCCSLS
jgi:hypothetical protein